MTAAKHEGNGADMAHECLDSMLNCPDQAHAVGYLLGLLNSLSGCNEAAKGARRGAAVILANVLERGLGAISGDEAAK